MLKIIFLYLVCVSVAFAFSNASHLKVEPKSSEEVVTKLNLMLEAQRIATKEEAEALQPEIDKLTIQLKYMTQDIQSMINSGSEPH